MTLFGLTISRQQKAVPASLTGVSTRGGWYRILEPFTGAWQRNIEWRAEDVLAFPSVYACVTLIASDIAKVPIQLMARDRNDIWTPTENPAYSPFLRQPNHFQNPIQFYTAWMISKLIHGNTYVLKERDNRGVVVRGYVLDPSRVRPLVADDSSVWYSLSTDNLSGLQAHVVVPASEIMHDLMGPLYHPLCGSSPLLACGLAAAQGIRIQNNSANFFQNGSQPGGILTTAGTIDKEERIELQQSWEQQFSGNNAGRVAVLGGGLTYAPLAMKATDSQMVEQLHWSDQAVCTAFHVPPYMIGIGPAPSYTNIEALQIQYLQQCLHVHFESIEWLLDRGLGLGPDLGIEFNPDALLRMDTPTRTKAATDAITGGLMSPNEARRRYFGLPPVTGGESPLVQQQNYSLEALAKRDALPNPFQPGQAASPPALPAAETPTPDDADKTLADLFRKELELSAA